MQIIFLPGEWMVVLFVVGWLVFQLGAALLGNRLPERLLRAKWFSERRFILESKRAELVHWLAILPFWVFGLWGPPIVIPIMFVYALAVNLPCIIAQRYNRPRLLRLLMLSENRRRARASRKENVFLVISSSVYYNSFIYRDDHFK
jgi:hypothetical protein